MTMLNINLPLEKYNALKELAESEGLEINQLAENALSEYISRYTEDEPNLSLEELKKSFEESDFEEANGIGYTEDDIDKEIEALIVAKRKQANT